MIYAGQPFELLRRPLRIANPFLSWSVPHYAIERLPTLRNRRSAPDIDRRLEFQKIGAILLPLEPFFSLHLK